ncbi:hypothetical protein MMC17_008794 [Xylographa soralifera]|nr:hypothetical protein [Xylographa soralifera]
MSAPSKATPRPTTTGLTPSASSPPRSVPSPAHLQAPSSSTKAGKSPYKHPSTGTPHNVSSTPHLPGSTPHAPTGTPHGALGTPHGTPLAVFGTPTPRFDTLLGSSPATGADMRVSGSELGMGTPALSLSALGVGMGISLSSMGLGPQQLAAGGILDPGQQDGEDEAQRRVGAIVELVGRRWGRVGREGVERCARRLGLECLWENNESEGRSTLSIAGNGLLVDVEWVGDGVKGVALSFPGAGEGAERSAGVGAEVLRRGLVGAGRGYVGLEAFAANLGTLAAMDVLGREGVSCFEAVDGVRASLARVWAWELANAHRDLGAAPPDAVQRDVLCKRSGRPRMHGAGSIGLRLEYWLARRLVLPRRGRPAADDDDAMDIDMDIDAASPSSPAVAVSPAGLHALLIDCEAHPAALYPSMRVSSAWVAPSVAAATIALSPSLATLFAPASAAAAIDWLDPAPTYLPSATSQPSVRFRARLLPPLVLPLQKAMELFNIVGAPLTHDNILMTTYTQLLFPGHGVAEEGGGVGVEPLLQNAVLGFERDTRVCGGGGDGLGGGEGGGGRVRHRYALLTGGQDWARTVAEIPFSHPRQLVMLLPLLRQWAFVGGVLRRLGGGGSGARGDGWMGKGGGRGVGAGPRDGRQGGGTPLSGGGAGDRDGAGSDTGSDSDSDSADERPASQKHVPTQRGLPLRRVDVSLSLAVPATPAITLTVPGRGGEGGWRTVTFHVGLNAEIEVEEEGGGGGKEGKRRKEDWGRVLAVSEDLGVVVEWVLGG